MTSDRVGAASPESALFAAMLRTALLPGAACGVAAIAVLWAMRGVSGALAAAGGVTVALVFFGAGLLVMKRIVTDNPMTMLTGALAVFLGQVLFLGVIILTLSTADWLDGVAFGAAVLVVALAWQIFQVVAFARTRRPVYDPSPVPDDASEASGPVA